MRTLPALALVLAIPAAAFADYTAIDLTPGGIGEGLAIAPGLQAGDSLAGGNSHATIWNGTAPGTDVHPTGQGVISSILSTNDLVGVGYVSDGTAPHAGFWVYQPSGATFARLNEGPATDSQANSVGGSLIVGSGTVPASGSLPGGSHALAWITAASAPTDLHPGSAYVSSIAAATDGARIVGTANLDDPDSDPHAALWNLSGTFFTDIHPQTGFIDSNALAVSGNQIVGYGAQDNSVPNPATHALLWTLSGLNDSTITFQDINPAGFDDSFAAAANGTQIVGMGIDSSSVAHALLWNGNSVLDLSQYLPADYLGSQANGIDAAGNIIGTATDADGNSHAILWSVGIAVPEPVTIACLGLPLLAMALRRRGTWGRMDSGVR